ncbi:MAG: tripartite tricarboxylate transporter substrate binding protein [Betaproteobacteria bacterium]|nr:tripartite tricarboxylate transporter substrate binding protein [Betaproteobacteria bacterium]
MQAAPRLKIAWALMLAALTSLPVGAAEFPARPVRFVVPYTPGAINDFIGRLLSQKLAEMWQQQVIVDNRAGGGTTIGTDIVAKSAPDGYTMLLTATAFAINPALYPKLPFDATRDFAPVTQIGGASMLLAVNSQLPVKNVRELVTLAKTKPGQLAYGSTGSGGSAHLMGEMFKSMAGIDVAHVPYKGLSPALTDVMSGQLSFTFGTQLALEGPLKTGRVRAIAATGKSRMRTVPELPTIAEAGFPDYDMTAWWGVAVPARTPKPIVMRLHDDIVRVLTTPDVRERLSAQGVEVAATTPQQFEAFLREEIVRWGKAVKQSGAKPD